jgi:hypothetical protein
MHVSRTPKAGSLMATFEEFYHELIALAEKYEKNNVSIKIENDSENTIIKIFGEKITALSKAKNGINDVIELAYTTAEHHPYWNLLYNSSEIANTVLEKWNGKLSKEDTDEVKWAIKELSQALEKTKSQI